MAAVRTVYDTATAFVMHGTKSPPAVLSQGGGSPQRTKKTTRDADTLVLPVSIRKSSATSMCQVLAEKPRPVLGGAPGR